MEPGLNLWPVTRPDPTRMFLTWWPDPVTKCFELRDLFWRRCATSECFLPKSLWLRQHTCIDHDEIIQSSLYTESHRFQDGVYSLCESNNKSRAKTIQKPGQCHTDPWPDLTRPKSLTRRPGPPGDSWPEDPVPTLIAIARWSLSPKLLDIEPG